LPSPNTTRRDKEEFDSILKTVNARRTLCFSSNGVAVKFEQAFKDGMKKNLLPVASICFVMLLTGKASGSCGQGAVTITNLPSLGGSSFEADGMSGDGSITGFSLVTGDSAAHAFLYRSNSISDIGTLGGGYAQGFAVNNLGEVVGEANTTNNVATHAFLYRNNAMVDLGTLGGFFSVATAISDSGVVTGNSDTAAFTTVAFRYENGLMTPVGTLGGTFSSAAAINQSGAIAGDSYTTGNVEYHAFLATNGTLVDLGTLGGNYSSTYALNDNGSVAGESTITNGQTHGFVYAGGTMVDVGTLGGTYSSAQAINNAGQVAGIATIAGNTQVHGFIYGAGVITDLGTLGGEYSEADAMNNLGQVVGYSTTTNGKAHAFLWQGGSMVDLNSLLSSNSGWELQQAFFINDAGRIVGNGNLNGVFRWYVLDFATANHPPVAVAGPDQVADCGTSVTLDGTSSSEPDGDALTFQWTEGAVVLGTNSTLTVSFDIGTHQVTLTVTDPCGQSSQTNVTVRVTDTTAPTISGVPASITVAADENCQATVPDLLSNITATDNCTPANQLVISQNPPARSVVEDGSHQIIVTVTDAAGNAATARVMMNVVDKTAPTIVSRPELITLSDCPPVIPDIRSEIVATDNCTPVNQLTVTQSPAAGASPGDELAITVTVRDASGNSASASIPFTVSDKTAPRISSAPESVTISNRFGSVPNILPLIVATDNCTRADLLVLRQSPAAGTLLNGDQRAIVVTVADAAGNLTSLSIPLVFSDSVPPYIKRIMVNPSVIWPPNHKMVPVSVSVLALDNVDPAPVSKIISISANESVSRDEIQITGDLTAKLAASKNAEGRGRIYTITVQCTDASGNAATCDVNVFVPPNSSPRSIEKLRQTVGSHGGR
jgi:probable HAF family extracellular repeat protein